MDKGITYIGMDLGTYKTSVASSNGVRDVVLSAVGWPKDHIARSMLGRDVVFGKDVVEHRLALSVVRPFEKGVLKFNHHTETGLAADKVDLHKDAARLLVEHAVSLTRPAKGNKIFGVIGAPARGTINNKGTSLEGARSACDAVMHVSEPLHHRLRHEPPERHAGGNIAAVPSTFARSTHLPGGRGTNHAADGRDYIDECFVKQLHETYPEAQFTPNMARDQGEARFRPRRQRKGHGHPARARRSSSTSPAR